MSSRPAELDRAVRARAGFCCEYCHLPARLSHLPFHIDHIVPHKHGGGTELSNLGFACAYCNRSKGANLSGIDEGTGQIVPLFNPRNDRWPDHFVWVGAELVGLTSVGRATIRVLCINHPEAVALRAVLIELDDFQ